MVIEDWQDGEGKAYYSYTAMRTWDMQVRCFNQGGIGAEPQQAH